MAREVRSLLEPTRAKGARDRYFRVEELGLSGLLVLHFWMLSLTEVYREVNRDTYALDEDLADPHTPAHLAEASLHRLTRPQNRYTANLALEPNSFVCGSLEHNLISTTNSNLHTLVPHPPYTTFVSLNSPWASRSFSSPRGGGSDPPPRATG